MKIYEEIIDEEEGSRLQTIKWKGKIWNILCNDRFEEGYFKIKAYCELCGPEKYVPKVLDMCGHRICNACLTRLKEMLQTATLFDCGRDRDANEKLKRKLEKNG